MQEKVQERLWENQVLKDSVEMLMKQYDNAPNAWAQSPMGDTLGEMPVAKPLVDPDTGEMSPDAVFDPAIGWHIPNQEFIRPAAGEATERFEQAIQNVFPLGETFMTAVQQHTDISSSAPVIEIRTETAATDGNRIRVDWEFENLSVGTIVKVSDAFKAACSTPLYQAGTASALTMSIFNVLREETRTNPYIAFNAKVEYNPIQVRSVSYQGQSILVPSFSAPAKVVKPLISYP